MEDVRVETIRVKKSDHNEDILIEEIKVVLARGLEGPNCLAEEKVVLLVRPTSEEIQRVTAVSAVHHRQQEIYRSVSQT